MPEVLDIRELGGDEPVPAAAADAVREAEARRAAEAGEASGASRWRKRAAAGVVVVLFVGVAYVLTAGRPRNAIPVVIPGPAGVVASPAEQAARAALDAWARFASTGDLGQLGDTFDRAGPQFARLRAEAPTVAAGSRAGPPYAFTATVRELSAGRNRNEQVVAAEVVVSRAGENDQRFSWELVMRGGDGRWRLWTVRDAPSAASTTRTGGAR